MVNRINTSLTDQTHKSKSKISKKNNAEILMIFGTLGRQDF